MDAKRRQELEARRKSLQGALASPLRESAITDALRTANVPFELSHQGLWTPAYLGISSSRIDWSRSPAPARSLPSETLEERVFAARSFLQEVAEPGDKLHFYYEFDYTSLDILTHDALKALDVLMNADHEIWITARPANWLIEIYRYGQALLVLPPEPSPEEAAGKAERHSHLGSLVASLRSSGAEVDLFERDDPAGPDLPRGPVMYKWRERKRTIGLPVSPGDYDGLADRLSQFLAEQAPGISSLAVDCGRPGSPIAVASPAAILRNLRSVMALAESPMDEEAAPRSTHAVTLFPMDGRWAVMIATDPSRWKVETTAKRS